MEASRNFPASSLARRLTGAFALSLSLAVLVAWSMAGQGWYADLLNSLTGTEITLWPQRLIALAVLVPLFFGLSAAWILDQVSRKIQGLFSTLSIPIEGNSSEPLDAIDAAIRKWQAGEAARIASAESQGRETELAEVRALLQQSLSGRTPWAIHSSRQMEFHYNGVQIATQADTGDPNAPGTTEESGFWNVVDQGDRILFWFGKPVSKGIQGILETAICRAALNSLDSTPMLSPAALVERVNLSLEILSGGHLGTSLFIGAYDKVTGALSYCGAGHPAPLLFRKAVPGAYAKQTLVPLSDNNHLRPGEDPVTRYEDKTVALLAGDTIVLSSGTNKNSRREWVQMLADSTAGIPSARDCAARILTESRKSDTGTTVVFVLRREPPKLDLHTQSARFQTPTLPV